MLLLAAVAGCGGSSANPRPRASGTPASHPAVATSSPSAAPATGLLYSEKSATFSGTWAVEHGCPVNLFIDFTDGGPRLRNPDTDGGGRDSNGATWPRLTWSPPCSGITPEIDFDGAPVAKVSGSQSESSCRSSAEKSLRDGTTLQGYRPSALAAGDEFCESAKTGRVILMRVTSLSANAPTRIDWSVTEWASPVPAETTAAPGGVLYADQTFVVGDKAAKANGDCVAAAVSIQRSGGPAVFYGQNQTSGDLVYFPTCLGDGKIRFGDPAAPVNGAVGASACEDAAAGSGQNSLDVDLTALHAGSEYCEYSNDEHSVVLVKVVALTTTAPASITFSATRWQAPVS